MHWRLAETMIRGAICLVLLLGAGCEQLLPQAQPQPNDAAQRKDELDDLFD